MASLNTARLEQVGAKVAAVNRTHVAGKLGLDRSYVSQVLAGRKTPGLDVAARIAREVGVSLDGLHAWLTKGQEQESASASVN
jgi:transcriptional regulator with XRE-family HTH domain